MTKVCVVKAMFFPVVMYECDSWTIKKAEHQRFDTFDVVLEKILGCCLDSKIKPVIPKENQPCIFIGRTHTEAPILCPPDVKSHITGKNPDAGRKPEGKRRRGQQRVRWLNGITDS